MQKFFLILQKFSRNPGLGFLESRLFELCCQPFLPECCLNCLSNVANLFYQNAVAVIFHFANFLSECCRSHRSTVVNFYIKMLLNHLLFCQLCLSKWILTIIWELPTFHQKSCLDLFNLVSSFSIKMLLSHLSNVANFLYNRMPSHSS